MVLNYSLAHLYAFIGFDLKWHYKIFLLCQTQIPKTQHDLDALLVNTLDNSVKFEFGVFAICLLLFLLQVCFANEMMVLC